MRIANDLIMQNRMKVANNQKVDHYYETIFGFINVVETNTRFSYTFYEIKEKIIRTGVTFLSLQGVKS